MKHVVRVVGHWGLLLHICISMAGFTLVLLFAITGLTLNHEDFGLSQPKVTQSTIVLPLGVLAHPDKSALGGRLRDMLGVRSPITDYREDPDQIQMTFAAPGHRTVVTINRAQSTGEVESIASPVASCAGPASANCPGVHEQSHALQAAR